MRYLLYSALALLIVVLPAEVSAMSLQEVNAAEHTGKLPADNKINATTIKAQILLDRAHFSPGEIDGKLGENVEKALRAFAEANSLPSDIALTVDVWNKLTATSSEPALIQYVVTAADLKGPFLEKQPAKLEDMKDLKALRYRSVRERLAERFHMSEQLLAVLNPNSKFDKVGETIVVASAASARKNSKAIRLDVDKDRQTVKAYSQTGELLAFYPASVGSDEKPTPKGSLKVVSVHSNPVYRYNPDYKFKGVKSKRPFTIKPGPNNPVGSTWIKLSEQGYGIHGTPEPSKVSKSESHGCVRMTNWDAQEVAQMVKAGTAVNFIEAP